MKSDVIHLTSEGVGFDDALSQSELVAKYKSLPEKSALHLRLLTEEMVGMMHALTGEREADFWIDDNDGVFALHLQVETNMNAEMRRKLLAATKSGSNSAAKGVIGKMRDLFERLIEPENGEIASDVLIGLNMTYANADFGNLSAAMAGLWSLNRYRSAVKEGKAPAENWDELEKSVIARLADDVQIGISGQNVEMVIYKKF
ncbi:MAG: hypothetical protein K6D94_11105 [Clostridiales bacterium]|nr:hypothetical protein [Clostridiales bacterium]